MEGFIERLFYVRINPTEMPRPDDPHTRELERKYAQALRDFEARIAPELHREFGAVIDDCVAVDAREGMACFAEGFRLGAGMMLDVLGYRKTEK